MSCHQNNPPEYEGPTIKRVAGCTINGLRNAIVSVSVVYAMAANDSTPTI